MPGGQARRHPVMSDRPPPVAPAVPAKSSLSAAPAPRARKASRLRKSLAWVIGVLLLLLLFAGSALLFKDPILKALAEHRIRRQTGLETRIGKLQVGLRSSTMAIEEFVVRNSPQFGGSALFNIPELYLELDPEQTARGKLGFKEIRLQLSELNVVKDTNGLLNLEALQRSLTAQAPAPATAGGTNAPGPAWHFGGIQKLTVSLGRLSMLDLQQPRNNQVIELGITNEVVLEIKSEEDFKSWLASLLLRILLEQLNDPSHQGWKKFQLFLDGLQHP